MAGAPIDLAQTRQKLLDLSAQVNDLTHKVAEVRVQRPNMAIDFSNFPERKKVAAHLTHRRACSGGSLGALGIVPSPVDSTTSAATTTMDSTRNPQPVSRRSFDSRGISFLSSPCSSDSSSLQMPSLTTDGSSWQSSTSDSRCVESVISQYNSPSLSGCIDKHRTSAQHLKVGGKLYPAVASDLVNQGQLGRGINGAVMKMWHVPSQTTMAVKILPRNSNEQEQKRVLMELHVMMNIVDSPFIVKSFGCIVGVDDVFVCMEQMTSCLGNLIKTYPVPFPEDICGHVAYCLVHSLSYLKEKHDIIHRDVKPSNILLDAKRGVFKICDFGISGHLVNSRACTRDAGCTAYMSPERFLPDTAKGYDIRSDVWSMGVTLVELATAQFPYPNCSSLFEVLTRIIEDPAPQLPRDSEFSEMFHTFIRRCLSKDFSQRPTFSSLKDNDFILAHEQVDVCGWYRSLTS